MATLFGKELKFSGGLHTAHRFPFRGTIGEFGKEFRWRLVLHPWCLEESWGKADSMDAACAAIEERACFLVGEWEWFWRDRAGPGPALTEIDGTPVEDGDGNSLGSLPGVEADSHAAKDQIREMQRVLRGGSTGLRWHAAKDQIREMQLRAELMEKVVTGDRGILKEDDDLGDW